MSSGSQGFTTRPELRGSFGMVASSNWLASSVGMSVLERGGNAFDAAVAAGLTLQVVEPHLNGPGGDLPAIFWSASRGEAIVLCAQGTAPRAATIQHYKGTLGLDLVPGTGLLAAVVPGAFDGWMLMLRDFGTVSLRDAMAYAIGYATDGYSVLPEMARAIRRVANLFRENWTTSASVYLPAPEPFTQFRNPTLAATYRRIVQDAEAATSDRDGQIEHARGAFSRGFVAEAMVGFATGTEWLDSSGHRHGGLLSEADMAGWAASYEEPISVGYREITVMKPGAWSQAPVFLQQLMMLNEFDLVGLGFLSDAYVHTIVEISKLAFADREAWYGDPGFVDVPLEALLSHGYARTRAQLVNEHPVDELRPGSPDGREPHLVTVDRGEAGALGIGEPTRGDTCHLDVVDRLGNVVSATPSGGWLSGSPVIPELGFCLGTRAQMFWLDEIHPNALAPGKRPRTTLSPTLALRDGQPYLALGTPGGDAQDQWSLHVFLANVLFGLNLQAAIDAPSFHTEAFPNSFYPRASRPRHVAVEERMDDSTIAGLRKRGHKVEVAPPWSGNHVSAVGREPDGTLKAAASPRHMHTYAVGR
jgi:gamma-glutamyltranspeptidase / glutathione hydrolase